MSSFDDRAYMVGQDRQGNWVVWDQKANAGGLFITRDAALRYVRSECRYQPRAVIMVSGNFELVVQRADDPEAKEREGALTRPMTQTEARLRRFKRALRQVTIELRGAQLAKNPDLIVDLLDQRDQLVKVIEELERQS